jgi:hypothetical protein
MRSLALEDPPRSARARRTYPIGHTRAPGTRMDSVVTTPRTTTRMIKQDYHAQKLGFMLFHPDHHIVYSSNELGGFWRVVVP